MASVMALEFLTNILLLAAVQRLCRENVSFLRNLPGCLAGSMYVGVCHLYPQLGHPLLYCLSRALLCLLAFGIRPDLWRKLLLFFSLSAALTCITRGCRQSVLPLALCIAAIRLLWVRGGEPQLLPVELSYRGREVKLTALRDTGNTLRDPVTGKSVLVVGSDVARQLMGLSSQQLRSPVQTVLNVPGLRLIPYRTISGSGFLLAVHLQNVRIGSYSGNSLVAFAPEGIGNGNYQALTGGMV